MLGGLFGMLRMFLGKNQRCRRNEQCNSCCDNKSYHMNSSVVISSRRKLLDVLIEFFRACQEDKHGYYHYLLTRRMTERFIPFELRISWRSHWVRRFAA